MSGSIQLPTNRVLGRWLCSALLAAQLLPGRATSSAMALAADGEAYQAPSASKALHKEPVALAVSPSGEATRLSTAAADPPHGPSRSLLAGQDEKTFRQAVIGSTPTGTVQLGTPPVTLSVILDTGSDKFVAKTWNTVQKELSAIDRGLEGQVQPTRNIYDHSASSTYLQEFTTSEGVKKPKRSYIVYGSGVAMTDEGRDNLVVGGHMLTGFPLSEISADSLAVLHSKRLVHGVLGLQHMKNNSLGESVFSQLRAQHLLSAFGYCRGKNNDGVFIWGDASTEGSPVEVIGQIHWAVKLSQVHVTPSSSSSAPAPKLSMCSGKSCAIVIDTGSNIIGLPTPVLSQLVLHLGLKSDCSNLDDLPALQFTLGDDLSITLPGAAYVMKLKLPSWAKGSENVQPPRFRPVHGHRPVLTGAPDDQDMNSEGSTGSQEESHSEHDTPGKAESFLQLDASAMSWQGVLEEMWHRHGIDLRLHLEPHHDQVPASPELCMPALVPLDKKTPFGDLWVIGTPLFEKYYTRWSWKQGDASPKIFFKERDQASACTSGADALATSDPPDATPKAPSLMRSEGRRSPQGLRAPGQLHEIPSWEMEDLRLPRWVQDLHHL